MKQRRSGPCPWSGTCSSALPRHLLPHVALPPGLTSKTLLIPGELGLQTTTLTERCPLSSVCHSAIEFTHIGLLPGCGGDPWAEATLTTAATLCLCHSCRGPSGSQESLQEEQCSLGLEKSDPARGCSERLFPGGGVRGMPGCHGVTTIPRMAPSRTRLAAHHCFRGSGGRKVSVCRTA